MPTMIHALHPRHSQVHRFHFPMRRLGMSGARSCQRAVLFCCAVSAPQVMCHAKALSCLKKAQTLKEFEVQASIERWVCVSPQGEHR